MDIFGIKFSMALGAWKLRCVLMLEDAIESAPAPTKTLGQQIAVIRDAQPRLN